MMDWHSPRGAGDDAGQSRISIRDWLADAQRRMGRYSLRAPAPWGAVTRSPPMLGVSLYRRAAGAIRRLPLARSSARPEMPLVLRRRPRLTAVGGLVLTIQSSHPEPQERQGPPPRESSESVPEGEIRVPAAEAEAVPPTPNDSIIASVTGTVRRLLARPRKRSRETPSPPAGGPPPRAEAGSDSEVVPANMGTEEELDYAAAAESEAGEAILEEALEEHELETEEHKPVTAAPSNLAVTSRPGRGAGYAAPRATPEVEQTIPAPQERFEGASRPRTGTQPVPSPAPVPLISRLIRAFGPAPERASAEPVTTTAPAVAAGTGPPEGGAPAGEQGGALSGEQVSRTVPTDEETLMTPEGTVGERAPARATPSAPSPGGILVTLHRLVGREPPPAPPIGREVSPAEERLPMPSGEVEFAAATAEQEPPPRPDSTGLGAVPPESRAGGLLLTLRRLVRREAPAAAPAPAPAVQRQPARTEEELPARSAESEAAAEAAEPMEPPPPEGPAADAGAPVSRPGGLLLTLRRLVRGEAPPSSAKAEVATTPAALQPDEAEPAEPVPATAPCSDATSLLPEAPPRVSRSVDLDVEPWMPVYRSLAPRRPSPEDGGGREAAWIGSQAEQWASSAAAAMPPLAPTGDGQTTTATAADRQAEEGYALAREAGGIIAIEREAAVGEASTAAAGGALEMETAPSPGALEKLAQQVYEIVRRRLQVERERAGLGSRWF